VTSHDNVRRPLGFLQNPGRESENGHTIFQEITLLLVVEIVVPGPTVLALIEEHQIPQPVGPPRPFAIAMGRVSQKSEVVCCPHHDASTTVALAVDWKDVSP